MRRYLAPLNDLDAAIDEPRPLMAHQPSGVVNLHSLLGADDQDVGLATVSCHVWADGGRLLAEVTSVGQSRGYWPSPSGPVGASDGGAEAPVAGNGIQKSALRDYGRSKQNQCQMFCFRSQILDFLSCIFVQIASECSIADHPLEERLTNEQIELVARVCHEANAAYCRAIGDNSQPDWSDAPEWQRSSAIKGVDLHATAAIHGRELPPSASHDSWLAEKVANGWVYGTVKDADAKTHPCIVPYEQLPIEQRMKDYIFGAVATAMAKAYSKEA